MFSAKHINTGKEGEFAAQCYLSSRDFHILEINSKFSFGELDIVAREKETLVFIEVKSGILGRGCILRPEDHFTLKKLKKIQRLAEFYINKNNLYDEYSGFRIDLIVVYFPRSKRKGEENDFNEIFKKCQIFHYKNVG